MKTPLKKLISLLEEVLEQNPSNEINAAIALAEISLPGERETIEMAYMDGKHSMISSDSRVAFATDQEYFDKTFKQ